MPKDFWINLPVADVDRARAFFEAIGFGSDGAGEGAGMGALRLGEKGLMVMLVPKERFAHFAGGPVADATAGAEVMISFDAASRDEVDALATKVGQAGGSVFGPPAEIDGWMYGAGFADLDGHRWNILHMDHAKLPGRPA
jgi:predicted lactoylglutathione lyase